MFSVFFLIILNSILTHPYSYKIPSPTASTSQFKLVARKRTHQNKLILG